MNKTIAIVLFMLLSGSAEAQIFWHSHVTQDKITDKITRLLYLDSDDQKGRIILRCDNDVTFQFLTPLNGERLEHFFIFRVDKTTPVRELWYVNPSGTLAVSPGVTGLTRMLRKGKRLVIRVVAAETRDFEFDIDESDYALDGFKKDCSGANK